MNKTVHVNSKENQRKKIINNTIITIIKNTIITIVKKSYKK